MGVSTYNYETSFKRIKSAPPEGGERIILMIAEKGMTVSVHYTGSLADGEVFDSSRGRETLKFTLGAGQMIPGFDRAVEGMKIGEEKTVVLSPEEAYGHRRDDLIFSVDRHVLPKGYQPFVGDQLQMAGDDGSVFPVSIISLEGESVILDGNHRLAGKELTFELELMEVDE